MKAVIMAGGGGTRLLPLTENMPKPLAPLCTKPACCYILDLLKKHGCTEAIFTLMYKGEMIEKYFDGHDYDGIHLGFCYEEKPLGTAGAVKAAAKNFSEPFAVISGDALCDFDLTSAMRAHKDSSASVTIITRRAADPREYGIVTQQDGRVTGFIEKPSFIGCTEDKANTGVYIISPELLQEIPDGFADFARDVFPMMQKRGLPIYAYEETGYWCDIGDLKSYKRCQRDIMEGKVNIKLKARKITENGYCDSGTGSYTGFRPPYYIGKNVSVGENTVIRGGAVIGCGVTVGSDCVIDGAVLLDGAFIGDNVRLCDCIVCRDAAIDRDSAVYENAVIGENSHVGQGCIIMPDVKIWANKRTDDNITISADIEAPAKSTFSLSDEGFTGQTNITATPQVMTRLGAAVAAAGKRICVGCRADNRSRTFAQCLIAGINAAGGDCYDCTGVPLPVVIHRTGLLCGELTVYVSVSAKTRVTISAAGGMPITREQERTIEGIMNRGGAPKAMYDSFGKCTVFDDGGASYTAMLTRLADFNSGYNIRFDCGSRFIKDCAEDVFRRISDKNGKRMIVSVDTGGRKAEIFTPECDVCDTEKLLLICFLHLVQNGEDIALPQDMIFDMEQIASGCKGRVYRYRMCSADGCDSAARSIGKTQPFVNDGCVLALTALKAAADRNIPFAKLVSALPEYKREKRYVPLRNIGAPTALKSLSKDGINSGEGVIFKSKGSSVLIRSSRNGSGLYLYAESRAAETAKELCDFAEHRIEELSDGQ